MGLGWEIARSSNYTLGSTRSIFLCFIGKCSKMALAAAVSDILKAWKKWKILCVVGPRNYLGSVMCMD